MLSQVRKIWDRGVNLLPRDSFHFDRPLVLIQSDDWGRVGLRDQEGLEALRSAGIELGEHPYDFYTLETADDLAALCELLRSHRDSVGRSPCVEMNFVQANLDFARMNSEGFRQIHLLPLADGLPAPWDRPGLFEGYREGIARGVFVPALHGTTHFCRRSVNRYLTDVGERGALLRTLWEAGTPYIYWRMPWIGFEYWDPESENGNFLTLAEQSDLIGHAAGTFTRMFSTLPQSACAPGYRANPSTHQAWVQFGVRIAQNGPERRAPHFDRTGMIHLYRTLECEPATNPDLAVEQCLRQIDGCIARGIPAILGVHSINFHSSVKDFRTQTLSVLDQIFTALETKYPNLIYAHDRDVYDLVHRGMIETRQGAVRVNVTKKISWMNSLRGGAQA